MESSRKHVFRSEESNILDEEPTIQIAFTTKQEESLMVNLAFYVQGLFE